MLLNASRAVSDVTANAVPAVAVAGVETKKFVAVPALTEIDAEPSGPELSDAVSVALSAFTKVAFSAVELDACRERHRRRRERRRSTARSRTRTRPPDRVRT